MKITTIQAMTDISAEAWDALVGENNPFVEHAFLSLLETSGSVGPGTGWMPAHVLVWDNDDDDVLVGAAPTYVKTDSYGEYIFDWTWAEISQRLGIEYYPKIVVAVPFTPATGPRLLYHPERKKEEIWSALVLGLKELLDAVDASSLHILFCLDEEATFLEKAGLARRGTHQYHWRNNNYKDFDDFVGRLRSTARKQIRKERRRVQQTSLAMELIRGDEAGDEIWSQMYRLYMSTGAKKWGTPYLTKEFFQAAGDTVGSRALLGLARDNGRLMAGTLSFQKGKHLYGRYWGCFAPVDCLHFELCYYQLIEYTIAEGYTLLEAGAQGAHKIKRGFLPTITHSAHYMSHPLLHSTFVDYTRQELESMEKQMEEFRNMGPFRSEEIPSFPPIAGQEA